MTITVKPHYNEVLGTMKITLLYQVSHYIRVKKLRNIKSWAPQNYLVIRGFCYIRPLYNEVPLYFFDQRSWESLNAYISDFFSRAKSNIGQFAVPPTKLLTNGFLDGLDKSHCCVVVCRCNISPSGR